MTLTKVKPHRPTADSRKRTGHHHNHSHHYLKTYWPYLPIVAVLTVGVIVNNWIGSLHRTVLGYATDMSVASLLDDTNAQRAENGEGTLTLDSQLDQAAQAKANDMAARDYWSHNTPDGQTPWTFITAAGYDYQTAGENLAYGFTTAAETLTAWMNSPEHRDNILNTTYKDVGFGIANAPDYQNAGPETIVVAMYGSRAPAAVAAVTPKAQAASPAPQPTEQPQPAAPQPAPAAADTPIATSQPANTQPTPQKPTEPQSQPIERIQLISTQASWTVLTVGLLGVGALLISVIRHGMVWRKVLLRGERFALHHPFVDVATASVIAVSLILTHTVGIIR